MSAPELLDVPGVATLQVRSHRGLRIDILTSRSEGELLRGAFDDEAFDGIARTRGRAKDLVSTFWASIFLISEKFKAVLEAAGATGWKLTPVHVTGESEGCLFLLSVSGDGGHLYGPDLSLRRESARTSTQLRGTAPICSWSRTTGQSSSPRRARPSWRHQG